jgi:hypothetical protein
MLSIKALNTSPTPIRFNSVISNINAPGTFSLGRAIFLHFSLESFLLDSEQFWNHFPKFMDPNSHRLRLVTIFSKVCYAFLDKVSQQPQRKGP